MRAIYKVLLRFVAPAGCAAQQASLLPSALVEALQGFQPSDGSVALLQHEAQTLAAKGSAVTQALKQPKDPAIQLEVSGEAEVTVPTGARPLPASGHDDNVTAVLQVERRANPSIGSVSTPMVQFLFGSEQGVRSSAGSNVVSLKLDADISKTMLGLVLLLIAAVLSMSAFGMSATGNADLRASAMLADEKLERPERYFRVPLNELINILGIPAFSVLELQAKGLTGLPRKATILLLAAQSWILQASVLYLLALGIQNTSKTPPLPRIAIALATYLNILGHLGEIPVALLLMRHLHHFHTSRSDYLIAFTVCFIGSMVVPCAAIVVGGLFLCTATNFIDLLLKSVVFKFITNIDTWIVTVNSRTNLLAGAVKPLMVNLPNDKGFATLLNYMFCIIPVCPAAISFVLSGVGLALRQGG